KKELKTVIHYHDIGDYLTREQKLKMVKDFRSISSQKLDWQIITPNEKADWINQRDGIFDNLIPLFDNTIGQGFFNYIPIGVLSSRDSWVCNFDKNTLLSNINRMI